MKILLKFVSSLFLLACGLPAMAACTVTSTLGTDFGTVSSFTINTTPSTVNTNFSVNCGSGLVVALLSTDTINIKMTSTTATSGSNAALPLGSDRIPFRICFDNNCGSELLPSGNVYTLSRSQLLGLNIGGTSQVNFSIPLYLKTLPNAVVAAGTYIATTAIQVDYNVCTGVGALGLCLLGAQQTGTATLTLTTQIIITRDCTTLTTQPITFGTAPLVSSFTTFSGNITVICTKDSTYTVGITNGQHAAGNQRNMISGSTLLAYQIYKGSGTIYWGPTGTDRQSSTGITANADFITRVFPFNARILTTQDTPAAGSYTDTVSVDVSF